MGRTKGMTVNNESTHKTSENARRSFESVTGKKANNATIADVEQWLGCLRNLGRSTNTCRTYLSFIKQLAGLDAELPKRSPIAKRILSDEEIKRMLSVAQVKDYAWFAFMLLVGPEKMIGMKWCWLNDPIDVVPLSAYFVLVDEAKRRGYDAFQFGYWRPEAHWIGGVDLGDQVFHIDQHEINRRLKGMARKAGIGAAVMNMTTVRYTHERLISEYGDADKAAKALGIDPGTKAEKPARKADTRLHGIGRRSSSMRPA